MAYEIKINAFQGPFDLLFYLLDKDEINIYDIPIAQITEQYLHYLEEMEIMDLEVASEFLLLAAKLLSIKAKMLLPKPIKDQLVDHEEVDPRDELVNQLLEYKMFKEISHYLKEQEQYTGQTFTRAIDIEEMVEKYGGNIQLKNLNVNALSKAFASVLANLNKEELVAEVTLEEISIEKKMEELTRRLFISPGGLRFSQLFSKDKNIKEVVITFLALLELTKIQQVYLSQNHLFGEIIIMRNEQFNCEIKED